jgi:hypothetical protein
MMENLHGKPRVSCHERHRQTRFIKKAVGKGQGFTGCRKSVLRDSFASGHDFSRAASVQKWETGFTPVFLLQGLFQQPVQLRASNLLLLPSRGL